MSETHCNKTHFAGRTVDHTPVMAAEIAQLYCELHDEVAGDCALVDGTVGEGGHARWLMEQQEPTSFFGYDRDPVALQRAEQTLADFDVVHLVHGSYAQAIQAVHRELRLGRGVYLFLDLGLGSHQFDSSARGFSYQRGDEEFDLRFDPDEGEPAWAFIARSTLRDVAVVLRDFGEFRKAGPLAKALKGVADDGGRTVQAYVDAIKYPYNTASGLARIFQALRLQVNHELDELDVLLDGLQTLIEEEPGRVRFAVLSYHSLEDRRIKSRFRLWAEDCECPPRTPICICDKDALGVSLYRKGRVPSDEEIAQNSRSRSARLRVFDFGGTGEAV